MTQQAEQAVVPVQSSGLELFDLKIQATPLAISWNKDALSAAVNAVLAGYRDVTVTEDMVPAIKSEMAGLNKLKDRLDCARKDIIRQIKAPLDQFDQDVRTITSRVTETRGTLDEQVKAWEMRDRESRRASVQFMIDAAVAQSGIQNLIIPVDERWLNKTARTAKTAAEIDNLILKTRQEREATEQLERARQDRVTLVSKLVQDATGQYGFELPMGKFTPFLSLNITAGEAELSINKSFDAEKSLRARTVLISAPETVFAPPKPVPARTEPTKTDDDFVMPTFVDPAPIAAGCRVLSLIVSYDLTVENDVYALIERLLDLADVKIL